MKCTKSAAVLFAVTSVLAGLSAFAAEPPVKVIRPEDARKHVDQRVTVTFKVQHAKFATNPDRVYLDSEKDYKDPKNLGLLIQAGALSEFKKAGIEKPAEHFDGKTVRATGKVFLKDDLVFIGLEKSAQVEIVKTTEAPKAVP